jgi:hypothetical protein
LGCGMNQDQARTETPHQHPSLQGAAGPAGGGNGQERLPSLRPTLQDPTTCQAPTTRRTTHGPRPPPPKGEEVSTGEPAQR